MTIAKITGPGLAALGVSVSLLWGCLITERILTERAWHEQARVLRELELLRQRQRDQPVAIPQPHLSHPRRPAAG